MKSPDFSCSKEQILYLKHLKRHHFTVRFIQLFLFFSFLFIWEFSSKYQYIDSFIFSSPSRIFHTTQFLFHEGTLFYHIKITVRETLISFSLVTVISILMATLLWMFQTLYEILDPFLVILNSLPKSALAPLFIVWLGNNQKTIILAAISISIFGSIITLYQNFMDVDPDKVRLIYTLGGSRFDVFYRVLLPGNLLNILSIMKVNIGLSLVGVIIGEFLAANAGLGYLIIYGSQIFRLDYVLMSIVILCILAGLMYGFIGLLEKFLFRLTH